jgi:hypothetical protein
MAPRTGVQQSVRQFAVVTLLYSGTLREMGHVMALLVEALRYSRKLTGSIPDGVNEIFY